ncbi:hypothetical protein JGU71_08915 [Antrihabitans sp. YC3-6]|uniref:DUF3592 domain-containing protein n=1 Tax=Antrihabitans stalagmiti TaxID=2799499 RepID=A0A934U3L3_9NOCA|nr:hypothetical protein [Antrihabitans stalagmiti]MBJ8339003.1 hypothetical protein [Antrihabitans stalagmiti]
MKNIVRGSAVGFAVLAFGYYLWNGLTYQSSSPYDTGTLAWANGLMALPIVAVAALIFAFAFTGDSIMSALTGRNSAAYQRGLIGIGTIRAVRQTGMRLNDQPEVRIDFHVESADGKIFDSYAKMIVPFTELALLRPGVVLPVRYLPERTDRVEVDRSADRSQAQYVIDQAMIRKGVTTPEKLDIAARGVVASAVVQSLNVPGEIRNGSSKIELGLAVTRPDGSMFTTRVEKFLPPGAAQHVQVGRIVTVHYLPSNEHEVVVALPVNA